MGDTPFRSSKPHPHMISPTLNGRYSFQVSSLPAPFAENVTGCTFSMSHAHGKAAKAALARMKQATKDMSTAGGKRPMASSDPPKAKKPADEEPAEVRAKTRTKAEEESYSCPAATVSLLGEREPPTRLTDPGPPARSQVEPLKEQPQAEDEDKSKWVHEGILEVKQPLQGGKQGGCTRARIAGTGS